MDIESVISGFPNATPLSGMENSWAWSPIPVLHFAGVLTADGKKLLQTNQRGEHDEGLARSVLLFARDREPDILESDRPLISLAGFHAPGYAFDSVAVAKPEVANFYSAQNPELNPLTYIVFPAYAVEFSGRETLVESEYRYKRMLRSAEINRSPVPFLKMRFDNPRTTMGSVGTERGFTEIGRLLHEIPELDNSPGAYVEFENRHGEVWRMGWDDTRILSAVSGVPGDPERRDIGAEEALAFAESKVRS